VPAILYYDAGNVDAFPAKIINPFCTLATENSKPLLIIYYKDS